MNESKAVSAIEIVDAIDELIDLRIDEILNGKTHKTIELVEITRRVIADGLRYHSASQSVKSGKNCC